VFFNGLGGNKNTEYDGKVCVASGANLPTEKDGG
jgi:hypothetical protein